MINWARQPSPILDIISSPELLEDPYPAYALVRRERPVYRLPDSPGPGAWNVARFADAVEALTDRRLSSAHRTGQTAGQGARSMFSSDPPEHTRLRRLASKAFTPRRVAEMRPRISKIVDRLLAPARDRRAIEVVSELAKPLPVRVIGEMLGVPRELEDQLRDWVDVLMTRGHIGERTESAERGAAATELSNALGDLIASRRREGRDDLITGLTRAQELDDRLSDAEILATVLLLLIAGYETTTNLISNTLLALLRHPDQLARLRQRGDRLPEAIEESLRFDAPVQAVARVTVAEVVLGGRRIPPGAQVLVLLGSANRDEDRFAGADQYDIFRSDVGHLSFGYRTHFCLGAPLARLEAEIAFAALLREFPRWEWDGRYERRPTPVTRGLTRLELELPRAARP